MSKYTTGEMAKLCGVSVRTVQYYDTRGILVPSELSEGGRRLYSEEDLSKLKIICFLRSIDLPINSIGQLLAEEKPENVISILLEEQQKTLKQEINERQEKLHTLEEMMYELKGVESFSVETIGDIANIMENKKKLNKIRGKVLVFGLIAEAIEITTFAIGITKGIWLPFILGLVVAVALCAWVSAFYFKSVAYICPECHNVFKPSFKEMFFANHTPKTRKLKCPKCGHKGFCVETCAEEAEK